MPISAYINIPIPLFLKLFAMECGTIGYSSKLLCLPVRKGTVGHILNITSFRNGRACVCSMFALRPIRGAFIIYAFYCMIIGDRRRAEI